MDRRKFVVGGGAAALTVAGLAIQRSADAQDATATPSTGTTAPETSQDQTQTTYQDFIAALATNLGIADATTVDTAIRTTLKQLVDDQLTAGHISADEATARKTRIDSSDSPLGMGGFGGVGGFGGGRGGDHGGPGGRNGGRPGGKNDGKSDGNDKSGETDTDESTPAAGATPTSTL
jgi:hypothetical protein